MKRGRKRAETRPESDRDRTNDTPSAHAARAGPLIVLERCSPQAYFDAAWCVKPGIFTFLTPAVRKVRVRTESFVQLEIFPEIRHVEAVDPRVAIGPDTRVSALFRVRYGEAPLVHQVYHDRHGWYCAEHGPRCPAVTDAVDVGGPR